MKISGFGLVLLLAAIVALVPPRVHAQDEQAPVTLGVASLSPRDQSRLLMEQGHAHEKAGQKDDALVDYTRAIDSRVLTRAEQALGLFDRGLLLDGMNRLNDALGDYSAALTLSPKFAAALNNRANVYRRLNRFTEARRDYQASLTAGNGQRQYPNYGLGQIAEAQGNGAEARAFYGKALAAEPGFALAADRLAALGSASGAIQLHPPASIVQAAETSSKTSAEASVDAPITLHPPGFKPVPQEPVHLRPPRPFTPAVTQAAYDGEGLALKPALDQGAGRGGQIQLGAWHSEAEAAEGWKKAQKRAGEALDGFSPHIVGVDLPAGRYYRLRVGAERGGPKALCAALTAKGLDCLPVRD